ncbi:MAG: TIGR03936 family radical SAM-associated protein [Eubacteriales bacterium]
MSKYVLKFSKNGYFKYTSHLDLLRFFKRSFKRAKIKLAFSQGFNPHPKIGFAQPLSLGYESDYEILEFEVREDGSEEKMLEALRVFMPQGLNILKCEKYEMGTKSLAAITLAALYEIKIPIEVGAQDILASCDRFLLEDEIFVLKKKKKGKEKEFVQVNIAQMIREIKFEMKDGKLILKALLDAGSDSNLSPELLITALLEYLNLSVRREFISVKREKIYFYNGFEM